ncbi:SWI5-dependent HO expression protein 4 [Cryomyces antarcticus]|nr:SWI5-dependent HO expression protein 4 [Cryomyces antarcticus]
MTPPDDERAEALARSINALTQSDNGVFDADRFGEVLTALDIRLPAVLRSQAIVATVKVLGISPEAGQAALTRFIASRIALHNDEDLIIAFSVAAAIFPVVPAVAAQLFLTEGFVESLVPLLQSGPVTADHGNVHTVKKAVLELLSAACMDKACRGRIDKYCAETLKGLTQKNTDIPMSILAALVFVKIRQEMSTRQKPMASDAEFDLARNLVTLFTHHVLNPSDKSSQQHAMEGLAYLSLQPDTKEELAHNTHLLKGLMVQLSDVPTAEPLLFGALNMFVHMTTHLTTVPEDQNRLKYRIPHANLPKTAHADPAYDKRVSARCDKVLEAGIVPLLVQFSKTSSSLMRRLMLQILLSLTKEQSRRNTMARQGAVKLVLQLQEAEERQNTAMVDNPPSKADPSAYRMAAHVLARILISVDPALVFSATAPIASAVRPLVLLLTDDADTDSERRDLLPVFEALLALTNLASTTEKIRTAIVRLSWSTIEDLLLSSNKRVQCAAVELVCNLMESATTAALYADGSRDAKNRVHVLLALADSEDLATRRGAGGALATLTQYTEAVTAILATQRGVEILLGLCDDNDSEELRHRGIVCIMNVITAEGSTGVDGIIKFKGARGKETLTHMVGKTKIPEIKQLVKEALETLQ